MAMVGGLTLSQWRSISQAFFPKMFSTDSVKCNVKDLFATKQITGDIPDGKDKIRKA
jgi:hypothetical protein